MTNILDGICPDTPLLDFTKEHGDWPKSATRREWLAITRRIVQVAINDMDLDPAAVAEVEQAFIGAGLL